MKRKCEICDGEMIRRKKENDDKWSKRRFCSSECRYKWWGIFKTKENKVWTPEYIKEYKKKYRSENVEKIRELGRNWRGKNRAKCITDKRNERQNLKFQVISHYSNDKIKCVQCGFGDIRALEVDHIDNNGAEERKRLFGSRMCAGTTFYRWLRQNNYPEGYQILCANCNRIKQFEWIRK